MAASMKVTLGMHGMGVLVRVKHRGVQTNCSSIFTFQRRMTTVTKYQTSVDDSLAKLTTFRRHPGIVRSKPVRLPDALLQNVLRYLADKPVKQLRPNAAAMASYLWRRQRPLEQADLRAKAQEYASTQGVNDIDEEMMRSPDLSKENKKKIASVMSTLKRHVYHWKPITYTETTSCAYMMARIAPNYAVTYRVLNEIRKRMADFAPQNLLDFGSGVGTTAWAAHSLWGDSLSEFYCVDTSKFMHEISDILMRDNSTEEEEEAGNKTLIKGIYHRHFLPVSLQKKYDLTVSSFSLLELPSKADRLNTLRTLWNKTGQYLVLIECGTNEGYQTIMEARDYILNNLMEEAERSSQRQAVSRLRNREQLGLEADPLDAVGHVFAPCQHDLACPRVTDDSGTPCNFEQNFHHFNRKGLVSDLTTERFCYLVLKKGPRVPDDNNNHWPRIVRPVLARSRHVICKLCCANGQLQQTVITKTKHGRELYRCARYSKWGDLLPISKETDTKTLPAAKGCPQIDCNTELCK